MSYDRLGVLFALLIVVGAVVFVATFLRRARTVAA
jgi:hypothetical protein